MVMPLIDHSMFGPPFQKLRSATKQLAQSHQSFSHNIEVDIEKPLREFTNTDPRYRNLSSKVVQSIQRTAKEVDEAQRRADKLKDKGLKAPADKVADAVTDVEKAKGDWNSEAPLVFESLQEVDEARWDHFKNALIQLETYASDMSNSNSTAITECLNSLLEVQTADEIAQYSIRAPTAVPATTSRERRMSQAPPSNFSASTSLAPPIPALPEDVRSQRSASIQEKPKKESVFKRMKTVVKGRRQSVHPYGQQLDSPERDVKRSSTSNLGRGLFGKKKEPQQDALSPPPTRGAGPSDSHPSLNPPENILDRVPSHRSNRELPDITRVSDSGFGLINGNRSATNVVEPTPAPVAPITEEVSVGLPSFIQH
jgi:flagellar hook-basal body complex protein FliE